MIHIVFQEADVAVLQKSFSLDAGLRGDIMLIKDDYAVGPLGDLYNDAGIEARKAWWRQVLAGGDYDGLINSGHVDDYHTVTEIRERMYSNTEEVVWIWAAENKHDVSGYYWLLPLLEQFQGRVSVLYLHNLPFINEKGGIFYPVNLFSIPPREFVKAKKLARIISPGEFDLDREEWLRLCRENKGVRILEGGKKLVQHGEDFYDPLLLQHIGSEWQKAGRLLYHFMHKSSHTTGDAYLLWRLKLLIRSGTVAAQGDIKHAKDFDVKAVGAIVAL